MQENKYTVWFYAALITAVLLNAFLVMFVTGSRDYFETEGLILTRKQIMEADKILSAGDHTGYGQMFSNVVIEISKLSEYQKIMNLTENGTKKLTGYQRQQYSDQQIKQILERYPYSEAETLSRLTILQYCEARLRNANKYSAYADQVVSNASLMSDVSIFNDSTLRRILKTGQDFYGHDNIRVSAVSDLGVKELFRDYLTDIVAVILAFVCAVLYYRRCHAGVSQTVLIRNRSGLFAGSLFGGVVLLYGVGAVATNALLSLGDLSRSIQSVGDYYTCPYMVSVGSLIAMRILFKAFACLILYLIFTGVLFCHDKKIKYLAVVLVASAEMLLDRYAEGVSIYAAFRSERYIMDYGSRPVFGETIGAGWILAAFLLFVLVAAICFAERNIAGELLLEKERRERVYFDEINGRYTEARLIRHDINNHLTAIAMLLDEGKTEEARKYLGMVSEQMDEIKPPVKTGSSVLDAVLFGKVKDAQEKGIAVELSFLTHFADVRISDYDLCSVFGNLLDNAIEACEKLRDEDRRVRLSVKRQEDMICIFCENKYAEIRSENGSFVTLKSDKGVHGLGLKRIERIALKYNGAMEIKTEDSLFSISVLLIPG